MKTTIRAFALLLAPLFMIAASTALAQQGVDVEPNNTCETAQDVGAVGLPWTVDGSLDPMGDIDFYGFTGMPGEIWIVRHEGAPNGSGTLGDPLLGFFGSGCALIEYSDDYDGLNSRLALTVPADGRVVLAATAFPDFEFVGSGQGTYRLTVEPLVALGAITGRLIDAGTGDPLPGGGEPWASATLWRCDDFDNCSTWTNWSSADSGGHFHFETDYTGLPLQVGTYQVRGSAFLYDDHVTASFAVGEGEVVDLGDLELERWRFIGSLSGRLVDAYDGAPLAGDRPPYAYVLVNFCPESSSSCYYTAYTQTDADGRYHLEGLAHYLRVGTYEIRGFASDYTPATSATRLEVGEGEHADFGDLALVPFPLQFGEIQACSIPAQGGICRYGIELRNRSPQRFAGETWSQVFAYGTGGPWGYTYFQTGRVGAVNPKPEKINLKAGEKVRLEFEVNVPGSLPDYATVCATALVGQNPNPLFNVLGERFLFCVYKEEGALVTLSEKEGRKRLQELRKETHKGPRH